MLFVYKLPCFFLLWSLLYCLCLWNIGLSQSWIIYGPTSISSCWHCLLNSHCQKWRWEKGEEGISKLIPACVFSGQLLRLLSIIHVIVQAMDQKGRGKGHICRKRMRDCLIIVNLCCFWEFHSFGSEMTSCSRLMNLKFKNQPLFTYINFVASLNLGSILSS